MKRPSAGAVRFADYRGSTGAVWAYNGGGEWSPFSDLHLRVNYARAVRAPDLSELYNPIATNYWYGFADPCSQSNIMSGTATRAINCRAADVPASYNSMYFTGLRYTQGGNPNLKAEKSDAYTVGAVLQPYWVKGLSIGVDYYDISIENVIEPLDPQTIVDQCYDSPTLLNQYCSLFRRAGPAGGPNGEAPNQILEGSINATSINYADLRARGHRHPNLVLAPLSASLRLDSRLNWTHLIQRDDSSTRSILAMLFARSAHWAIQSTR